MGKTRDVLDAEKRVLSNPKTNSLINERGNKVFDLALNIISNQDAYLAALVSSEVVRIDGILIPAQGKDSKELMAVFLNEGFDKNGNLKSPYDVDQGKMARLDAAMEILFGETAKQLTAKQKIMLYAVNWQAAANVTIPYVAEQMARPENHGQQKGNEIKAIALLAEKQAMQLYLKMVISANFDFTKLQQAVATNVQLSMKEHAPLLSELSAIRNKLDKNQRESVDKLVSELKRIITDINVPLDKKHDYIVDTCMRTLREQITKAQQPRLAGLIKGLSGKELNAKIKGDSKDFLLIRTLVNVANANTVKNDYGMKDILLEKTRSVSPSP